MKDPGKLLSIAWWRSGLGGRLPELRSQYQQYEALRKHYGDSRQAFYARLIPLLRAGFTLKEIRLWGVLDPTLSAKQRKRYVSKRHFMQFQARTSPKSHAALLEDKEVFYRYAAAIGMPIPSTVGFLSCHHSRSTAQVTPEQHHAALEHAITAQEGRALLLKPTNGVYGQGLRSFQVQDGQLHEHGEPVTLSALMQSLPERSRHVLQERLRNHPTLQALTGVSTLQTLRVVTGLPPYPCARATVLSAAWRSVVEDTLADNFDYGRSGNLRARVDCETGQILQVVRAARTGFGLEDVRHHPNTDAELVGQTLPDWPQVIELLSTFAPLFYPIRLVGWDVALTDKGPRVLEGNFWFDPGDNATGGVQPLIERFNALKATSSNPASTS